MFRKSGLAVIVAAFVATTAAPVLAQPPHCPPGHAKKGWCSPGVSNKRDRVVVEREYVVIRDYDRYGLRAPRDGYYYGILNEEVFLISKATQEIIEGIGAVGYLLNRY